MSDMGIFLTEPTRLSHRTTARQNSLHSGQLGIEIIPGVIKLQWLSVHKKAVSLFHTEDCDDMRYCSCTLFICHISAHFRRFVTKRCSYVRVTFFIVKFAFISLVLIFPQLWNFNAPLQYKCVSLILLLSDFFVRLLISLCIYIGRSWIEVGFLYEHNYK